MRNLYINPKCQMLSTYLNYTFKMICIFMLLCLSSCSDDEVCAYDEDNRDVDCADLELNIGDVCDANGDGIDNGIVNEFCECIAESLDFDCEELQLNFGDMCDSDGDGISDGTITDDCECLPDNTVGFDCEELQVNFGDPCDFNGDGNLDGIITDDCNCVSENTVDFDCEALQLNFEVACDSDNDGVNDGTVSENCECTPGFPEITACPGFIQNGDFEITTGDPNAVIDEDVDLATNWKALWQSSTSLADLFDNTTTNFGQSCFTAPTPSTGVFASIWVENSTNSNALYREGMFNELTVTINQGSGLYSLSFDYANMSESCSASNDVKVGVYGVYHPNTNPLPASPTGIATPTNLDLFGSTNTVFLGEVVITSTTTNAWQTASFTIDTSALSFPTNGINHIMITNSHLPFDAYGKMYVGFDNFCLVN